MTGQLLRSLGGQVRRFRADQNGATAIEYALIAAGVGATVAATVYNVGSTLKAVWWDKLGSAM
jgi:pilus assembly protein Flp/PilA